MANPTAYFQTLQSAVNTYLNALAALNQLQDRLAQDSTLAAAAATAAQAQGRSDMTATDFNNIASAIVQFNFTFNSGSPPQKSYLYKLL